MTTTKATGQCDYCGKPSAMRTCLDCMTKHRNRTQRRVDLSTALHTVSQRYNLAQPSAGTNRAEFIERHELESQPSGYVLHFRLPRWNGKAEFSEGEIDALYDETYRLHAHLVTESELYLIRKGRLATLIDDKVAQAARELRGRALLELLDSDWVPPPDSSKEAWQRLERALVRLIEKTELVK